MDIYKKLKYILESKQKRQLISLAVMIFVGGLLETASVSALIPAVNLVLNPAAAAENKYYKMAMDMLHLDNVSALMIPVLLVLILLFIIKNLYMLMLVKVKMGFITFGRNKLISKVLHEFLNRPYEFYLDADIPTVFRLTDQDLPNVFNMLIAITSLASELVVVAILGVVLVIVDWKFTIYMVAILGLLTLIIVKWMKPKLNDLGQKNQSTQSRIAKWRIEAIYGIKDVKVLHREAFFADNYFKTGELGAEYAREYSVLNSLPKLLIETIFIASILSYMIFYIASGNEVSQLIAMMSAFGLAAYKMVPGVNRVNTYLTEIAYYKPCLDYVYENMNINALSEKMSPVVQVKNPNQKIELKHEIALKDIVYAYPNTDKLIFNHADMVIPYGKSVGIMGASGAGKSTIVDVLLGLLRIQGGKITCDDVDVFDNYPAWLAQIGYIPQSIYLIDEPIRNNIAFGIADDEIDDDRIWKVLEEAQLKEFIETLPEGLDTCIGERGVRLSGGQRQRLGIARALYHNPEILVFDEATSALDNETETAVMEAINGFHGKKTMVIIAHRLHTIEKCDIIYKVDGGKIEQTTL